MTSTNPKPGDTITWQQVVDGELVERTGTVWDAAPALGGGHCAEQWVIPNERLACDPYAAIVVAKVRKGRGYYSTSGRRYEPGSWFSESETTSPTWNASAAVRSALAAQDASRRFRQAWAETHPNGIAIGYEEVAA